MTACAQQQLSWLPISILTRLCLRGGLASKITSVTLIDRSELPLKCNVQVAISSVRTFLAEGLRQRLSGLVDVLIFNPPYVPTTIDEVTAAQTDSDIAGSWAGGYDGMQVTNKLLDQASVSVGDFPLVHAEVSSEVALVTVWPLLSSHDTAKQSNSHQSADESHLQT